MVADQVDALVSGSECRHAIVIRGVASPSDIASPVQPNDTYRKAAGSWSNGNPVVSSIASCNGP